MCQNFTPDEVNYQSLPERTISGIKYMLVFLGLLYCP